LLFSIKRKTKTCVFHYLGLQMIDNINRRYVRRKYVVNNVDMSSLKTKWQTGLYTNTHLEQHETCRTSIRNTHWKQSNLLFLIDNFYFLNDFSRKCSVTPLVLSIINWWKGKPSGSIGCFCVVYCDYATNYISTCVVYITN